MSTSSLFSIPPNERLSNLKSSNTAPNGMATIAFNVIVPPYNKSLEHGIPSAPLYYVGRTVMIRGVEIDGVEVVKEVKLRFTTPDTIYLKRTGQGILLGSKLIYECNPNITVMLKNIFTSLQTDEDLKIMEEKNVDTSKEKRPQQKTHQSKVDGFMDGLINTFVGF
jgi:hypothetical protein